MMNTFVAFDPLSIPHDLRAIMNSMYREDEVRCLEVLLEAATLPESQLHAIQQQAERLVLKVRSQRQKQGGVDAFMAEYDLSTDEGIALMCLAEAALRIPDASTVDKLIHDKIVSADWGSHRGQSESRFVNAASFALMLTGRLLEDRQTGSGYFRPILKKLLKRTGSPVIRQAVAKAMRILGRQFVMGRTIQEALDRSQKRAELGYRFSYDMLGEAARTAEDAERYFLAYQQAISAIGHANAQPTVEQAAGISIKLSALHPRYEYAQRDVALPVLTDRLRALAVQARAAGMNLTVDAEEADRLDLSLDIIEAVIRDPSIQGWNGFGLAVQAYQKRAFYLIDWLADLAQQTQSRLMVRLVKGAYWDAEIKDSQVKGLVGYPVFTRKVNTDLSYLACAKKLIQYGKLFYPQFATHNAYTVSAILSLMGDRRDFEFQCLKGMGDALYDQIVGSDYGHIPCRVYAPVGQHEDLLPYLVRRLLENGANSSFVNRIIDDNTPLSELTAHPWEVVKKNCTAHPRIPLPVDLFGAQRKNSMGIDLSDVQQLKQLADELNGIDKTWHAEPTFRDPLTSGISHDVFSVHDPKRLLGRVTLASEADLELAIHQASQAFFSWDRFSVEERAACLDRLSDQLIVHQAELLALLVLEAGKTLPDALGEWRETVDYCRYYAAMARETLSRQILTGPTGESNELSLHGRGVFLCISPWNFPLAIFSGQVMAALVAGNTVLAKPAEQTPLLAARAIELFWEAGVPRAAVQFLPGKGSLIGAAAVADERIAGVMFTGSTETAQRINLTLAQRKGAIVPFIAETGGQNVMIADSTALPEQLVMDVVASAFNSAGQRCSALRVLFLQEDIADKVIEMLKGAMAELKIGNPAWLSTDVGPVIDHKARIILEQHVVYLTEVGRPIYTAQLSSQTAKGSYFAPRAYEIPSLDLLKEEVFGPILHVIRYKHDKLDAVIDSINATGYGLTLGIHSRVNYMVDYILARIRVGNTYVNRNMIGAVVGVQPFGGEGLSGTGPKAGGPHYLLRLCQERTVTINTTAAGGNASLMAMGG